MPCDMTILRTALQALLDAGLLSGGTYTLARDAIKKSWEPLAVVSLANDRWLEEMAKDFPQPVTPEMRAETLQVLVEEFLTDQNAEIVANEMAESKLRRISDNDLQGSSLDDEDEEDAGDESGDEESEDQEE